MHLVKFLPTPVCNVATAFLAIMHYFISLWIVYLFRMGLYFFTSSLSGVFFLFLVVIYLDVPGIPLSLCSVHSRMTCCLFPFFAIIVQLQILITFQKTFFLGFLEGIFQPFFIDSPDTGCRYPNFYPAVFIFKEESLIKKVRIKFSTGTSFGVRNIIPYYYFLPRYLANSRHYSWFYIPFSKQFANNANFL